MENLKNLEKIAKIFQPQNIITSEEIDQVLKGIMEILASYKKNTDAINEDTKIVVNSLLEQTIKYNQETILDFKSESEKAHGERMKELQGFLNEVKTTLGDMEVMMSEVKDGKDADEEKIIEDVISRIKIDPTVVTVTAQEVRDKLASLKGEDRLDKSAIKGLEKILSQKDLDYAVATLQHQASFLINKGGLKNVTAGTNVTIDYTDPSNPVISSSGGGGGGSPGGSTTQLQYNNAGSFGGISGATTNGTAVTYTTGNLIANDVKASGSGGLHLHNNAGTDCFLTGSGGGVNNTAYGALKLDFATATTVPYLDASKNLTSSAVTPTELGYVSGVTSAIQTQLNAKQSTITFGTGVQTALGVNVGTAGSPVVDGGALGTPLSGTLTNATGLPIAGLVASTTTALGVGSIELGHATDTTLSRVSAGVIAVEGVTVPTISSTSTLTNKTLTTPTINGATITGDFKTDGLPDTDDTWTGKSTNSFNAGGTIAQFDCVYMTSSSTWALTDADAIGTGGNTLVMMAGEAGTNGNPLRVIEPGSWVRNDAWNWTVGGVLYLDTATAGGLTQTVPSGTDDVVKIVGHAVSADVIYFNPSVNWIIRV
tara:strand:+ start:722 stop:2515 length:1794 start_codon:yes stop_codon:yes gene_type:complete